LLHHLIDLNQCTVFVLAFNEFESQNSHSPNANIDELRHITRSCIYQSLIGSFPVFGQTDTLTHGHTPLRSTTTTLCQPFTMTTFAKCAFWCSAPAVWNSLPKTVLNSNSVAVTH